MLNLEVVGLSGSVKWNTQFSIGPAQPRKVVKFKRWTGFAETFLVARTDPFSFRPVILVEWIVP